MKWIRYGFTFSIVYWLALSSAYAQPAPGCPAEPNRVSVRAEVATHYDANSQSYRYVYTIHNDKNSEQEVNRFVLDTLERISDSKSPRGWFAGPYHNCTVIGWEAIDVADPDKISDTAGVPPSIVQIKPGASLSGFSFQSPKPPGPVKYFVTGYVPLAAPGMIPTTTNWRPRNW